jgi:hypothetical protein
MKIQIYRNVCFFSGLAWRQSFGLVLRVVGLSPDGVDNRKHQKDGQEKGRCRREEARSFALNVTPRQIPWAISKQRQGAPKLSFKVQHPMRKIVADRAKASVEVRFLPAVAAVVSDNSRAAIQTSPVTGISILRSALASIS